VQLLVGGQAKATRRASAHAPTVRITSPNGGESFSGAFTLAWEAADADGDPLTLLIQYSADNGAGWTTLRDEYHGSSITLDAAAMEGSAGQARLRVIASDGLLTGSDTTDGLFSVAKHAPEVRILTPDGALFEAGEPVSLRGSGFDMEDGRLSGAALRWRTDRLGAAGTGETLELWHMPRGPYRVTLTARDRDGQEASATIAIRIGGESTYLPLAAR
jgi:hypothetical protein